MKKNNFKYQSYQITQKEVLAPETILFNLKGRLSYSPGAFVQASLLNYGEGTFAPCSDTEHKEEFQLCIRGSGNLTNQLIKLLPGDSLYLRGPYGKGWPIGMLLGKEVVIITGGIGIIPMRSLIFQIIKNRKEFGNVKMISGFRTPEHILFREEIPYWKEKLGGVKIVTENGQDKLGQSGLITDMLKKCEISKNAKVLVCGPEGMIPICISILQNKGISDNNIYVSYERRMECGIGICQHCNIGKFLVCEDGPVFRYDLIKNELGK